MKDLKLLTEEFQTFLSLPKVNNPFPQESMKEGCGCECEKGNCTQELENEASEPTHTPPNPSRVTSTGPGHVTGVQPGGSRYHFTRQSVATFRKLVPPLIKELERMGWVNTIEDTDYTSLSSQLESVLGVIKQAVKDPYPDDKRFSR